MKDYKLKSFSYPTIIKYEENLNPQQLKVVYGADGPSLVLAGAGSGKTRVLIYRLAYLHEKKSDIQNILLVTFTNKAAHEMTSRAERLLKMSLGRLWAGTFHHIGNIILRKESEVLGYSPNFSIVDREDAKDLIDDCIEEAGFKKSTKLFPKKEVIYNIWSLSANSLKNIEDIIFDNYPHIEEFTPQVKRVITCYTNKKKNSNVMDFSDLLFNWLKVLNIDSIKDKYSSMFKYILVDEYQDTNHIQFEILKRLSSFHKNILVVGDDAQSIYSFRAADINNLLDFPKDFKNAKIFKLQLNYRSSPQILNLANEIIKHNVKQFPKELEAVKKDNELPVVVKAKDVYQQAQFVSQRVIELNREGIPLSHIAVLFRSRFQALEIEVELLKRNVPYLIRGGMRFFEQAHIKDILAYLKVTVNPKDELSFKRALSIHRGIGRGFAHRIWEEYGIKRTKGEDIIKSLPKKQKQGFREFNDIVSKIKDTKSPQEAIREILKTYADYCNITFDNPQDRISDLEELAKMAHTFPTIRRFILDLSSYEDFKGETALSSQSKDQILILSTIHQSKGLEWEAVFIIGFSDYEFPHPKALNSQDSLEEERRLFYVASTRSKSLLYITYPQNKYTFKNGLIISRPSIFLDELPKESYQEWNIYEPDDPIQYLDPTDDFYI